jgi:hypothetical protein
MDKKNKYYQVDESKLTPDEARLVKQNQFLFVRIYGCRLKDNMPYIIHANEPLHLASSKWMYLPEAKLIPVSPKLNKAIENGTLE